MHRPGLEECAGLVHPFRERYGLFFVLLAIMALTAPVAATDWPVTTGSDIATVIGSASSGDTITLAPGTYSWHDITITGRNLTFRAQDGHGPSDTIINAQGNGRIFTVTDSSSLAIDNLTLRNGWAPDGWDASMDGPGDDGGNGGAILSAGPVSVNASVIANCRAGKGGAGYGPFERNAHGGSGGSGGAIYTTGPVTIRSSTVSGCQAGKGGKGAEDIFSLYTPSGSPGGSGGDGGAVRAGGAATVIASAVSGCTAGNGGDGGYGFNNGRGGDGGNGGSGGAVYSGSTVSMDSSAVTGCSAGSGGSGGNSNNGGSYDGRGGSGGSGGAVSATGTVSMVSSTMSSCSAGVGGSSEYSGYPGAGGSGGAVTCAGGTIHFCRLLENHAVGASVYGSGATNAIDNWWGSNNGPSSSDTGGSVTANPWLVLTTKATPPSVMTSQTSAIGVVLVYNSDGVNTSAAGHVPDGIPVTFTVTDGSISPAAGTTTSGTASSVFTPPGSAGTVIVKTVADGAISILSIPVTSAGVSGAATTIVVDPATPSTLYTGIDGTGVYRSTTGGSSWMAATTQPANTRIKALVINQGDRTNIFAATYGGGIFRSMDSGLHWNACSNAGLANLNVLSLVNSSAGNLYAGTENGIYSSTDCDAWTPVNNGLP